MYIDRLKKTLRSSFFIVLWSSLAITIFTWFFCRTIPFFKSLELDCLNLNFKLRNVVEGVNRDFSDKIVIVSVDKKSIEELGKFHQWPRSYHAKLIEILAKSNASSIAFDILFIEPDKNPKFDEMLILSSQKAKNVFHTMFFSHQPRPIAARQLSEIPFRRNLYQVKEEILKDLIKERYGIFPFPKLLENCKGFGYANVYPDADGVVRSIPLLINYNGRAFPSIGIELACNYLGIESKMIRVENRCLFLGNRKICVDKRLRMLINYYGPVGTFKTLSYVDVLRERVPPSVFSKKIILIGATCQELSDITSTPFSLSFPGVEIHANIVANLIHANSLKKIAPFFLFFLSFILTFSIGFLAFKFDILRSAIGLFAIVLFCPLTSFFAFLSDNLWIDFIKPSLAIILNFIAISVYRETTMEKEARADPLTKVFNRRYFEARLSKELNVLHRGSRVQDNLSLILIDIDHFKDINDRYGHRCGDFILVEIASILSKNVRFMDVVSRYGGEEFAIILPKTNRKNACFVAERIRMAVENHLFYFNEKEIRLTISLGVAAYGQDAKTKEELISKSDRALYLAKRQGRNRVVSASELAFVEEET